MQSCLIRGDATPINSSAKTCNFGSVSNLFIVLGHKKSTQKVVINLSEIAIYF